MRKVRRVELARPLQVHGGVELPQFGIRHAELRVGQRVVGTRQRGVNVHLQRFIQLVQRDQHAAQIDQRFVRRGVLPQRPAETVLGQREAPRLIGDGTQSIPRVGELRRQFYGVLQMFLGGVHVALLQIMLRVHIVAQCALGDFELPHRDGVPPAIIGGVEIGVSQSDGQMCRLRGCGERARKVGADKPASRRLGSCRHLRNNDGGWPAPGCAAANAGKHLGDTGSS